MVIWPDVAPKACQVLRQYVENKYKFQLSFTVDPVDDEATMTFHRQRRIGTSVEGMVTHPLTEAMQNVETTSDFWASPNFVCFKFSDEEPHMPELIFLSTNLTKLRGELPENVFGQSGWCGMVIGKVLDGPIDQVRKLAAFEDQACIEFGVAKEEQTWEDQFFTFPSYFECSLLGV